MKRILAISDIHGCLDKFEQLLDKIQLTKNDKLIILGDNVDRGPDSLAIIFKIIELKEAGYTVVNIMGNHEEMLLYNAINFSNEEELFDSPDLNLLIHNGADETIINFLSLENEQKTRIYQELKSYKNYHIEGDYLFVHAGVLPNVPINNQKESDLMWIREPFVSSDSHGLPYTIIFGHTPTRFLTNDKSNKIWHGKDKIGIDCGCFSGGKLACLSLPTMKEYYV